MLAQRRHFSLMKEISKKKQCWAKDCNKEIKTEPISGWPYCEKHYRMSQKGYLIELNVPTSPKSVGKPG